jgi:hypothetical protein
VEEAAVPTEAALHEVLMRHPSLVPATDLGMGRLATVGFETSLASGFADLVLLDDNGRLCLVEVKKEGNPDTRRVVAQVMDYAAALWGQTVEEFERDVLRPMLGPGDGQSLREFVLERLLSEADDGEEAADRLLEALGETLRSGDFALLVAAPTIPERVQKVMEYLNARGLAVYGLEVSYFAGEVEAFVPRVVVRPTIATKIAAREPSSDRQSAEPATWFSLLPDQAEPLVRELLDQAVLQGAELQWRGYGPRLRVRGSAGPKVAATFEPGHAYLGVGAMKGIDPRPAEQVVTAVSEIGTARCGTAYASIALNAPREDLVAFLDVGKSFLAELLESVAHTEHPSPSRAAPR